MCVQTVVVCRGERIPDKPGALKVVCHYFYKVHSHTEVLSAEILLVCVVEGNPYKHGALKVVLQ